MEVLSGHVITESGSSFLMICDKIHGKWLEIVLTTFEFINKMLDCDAFAYDWCASFYWNCWLWHSSDLLFESVNVLKLS